MTDVRPPLPAPGTPERTEHNRVRIAERRQRNDHKYEKARVRALGDLARMFPAEYAKRMTYHLTELGDPDPQRFERARTGEGDGS